MATTRVFREMVKGCKKQARYINSCGGTRSTKTFSALQLLAVLSYSDTKPTVTSVVSETFPHLRKGAMRDFRTVMMGLGYWQESAWSKSESTYTFPSGSIMEFFSCDAPEKVHGPARDRLFINEAQNIKYETARQMFIRTRGLIVIDYNPTHAFWVHDKIAPKANCYTINSTYKDNPYLTPQQVAEIEDNRSDTNWWRVYGEGQTGQLEGLIYPDFEQIEAMPDASGLVECYGLDFGYTNDPTTLVHVLADTRRKILYADEEIYQRRLQNVDTIDMMKDRGISRTVEIFGDAAEPKSIDQFVFAGFNCKACYKGKTIVEQIQFVKGWKLRVTQRSVNLIKELRNYQWAQDKNGTWLNTPASGGGVHYDHALDALRYAVFTKLATFKKPLKGGRPKTGNAW